MSKDIDLEYFEKYIELEPIYDKFKYYDGSIDQDVETTAFCVLKYIQGFKEIQKELKREIKENYYNTSTEPLKFKIYAEDRTKELNNIIEDTPSINEDQVKEWLKEYFKINYIHFSSIYLLLTNRESLFLLGDDWLTPGGSPSIYPEVQNGLYHFTKREFVKMIKGWINYYLYDTINSNQFTKSLVPKEKLKFTDYFDEAIFDTNKIDLLKQLIISNQRQKDIAIITCLLVEKSIIIIKRRERASFFRALYDLIEIKPPNKFSGINGYINPYKYPIEIDNPDSDYKLIKNLIEKLF